MSGGPYRGYASPSVDPRPEDLRGGVLRRNALAAGVTSASHVGVIENLVERSRSRWSDLRIEEGELVGRPYGEPRAGHRVLTGAEIAARTAMQLGEQHAAATWDLVAEHLRDQVAAEHRA